MEREVMTVREVADYLRCHVCTVLRHARTGEIVGFKVGTDWRFMRADIEKYTNRWDKTIMRA